MTRTTSYYVQGEHPFPENELARLAAQAVVSWPKEARALRDFGLKPDADILEVGSGPGYLTRLLLEEVPGGTVTCLELDAGLLAEARAYLADQSPTRLSFNHGSILSSELPSEAFDLAYLRLVLQHIPAPVDALKEVARTLRPGGRVAIMDIDDELWGSIHPDPHVDAFRQVMQARIDLQRERGGDRLIGRVTPHLLRAAGFENIRVEAIAISSEEFGMDILSPQLNFRSRTAAMVEAKPEVGPACAELADAVDEWLTLPDASLLMLFFVITGEKPSGGAS